MQVQQNNNQINLSFLLVFYRILLCYKYDQQKSNNIICKIEFFGFLCSQHFIAQIFRIKNKANDHKIQKFFSFSDVFRCFQMFSDVFRCFQIGKFFLKKSLKSIIKVHLLDEKKPSGKKLTFSLDKSVIKTLKFNLYLVLTKS